MTNPLRIKDFTFPVGSLTADANGLFDVYSTEAVNGDIKKIFFASNNHTSTGSLLVFISGTQELVLQIRAGSAPTTIYPFTYSIDANGNIGSPDNFVFMVANDIFRIVGSGLGDGTSGNLLKIYYV